MLQGLHHVTALAGDPQRNIDFYTRFLGMKLVKRTVNFDEPAAYHFYYSNGDALLTFFPWNTARRGQAGSGQIAAVALGAGETMVDPDGIPLEFEPSRDSHGAATRVTLCESDAAPTAAFLRDVLGLELAAEENNLHRFTCGIDVLHSPGTLRGKMGPGIIHHLAFRVADEETQLEWREKLVRAGVRVSPVKDRLYFHSIYFREPGGVLMEIATAGPGFTIDEAPDQLGRRLCLPPWLEPVRDSIERRLPPVKVPHPEDQLVRR